MGRLMQRMKSSSPLDLLALFFRLGRISTEHDALCSAGAVRRGVRHSGGVALVRDNAFGGDRTLRGGACGSLHGRRDDSQRGLPSRLDRWYSTEPSPSPRSYRIRSNCNAFCELVVDRFDHSATSFHPFRKNNSVLAVCMVTRAFVSRRSEDV